MKKRMIAIALCLLMIGTVAATSAVSAAPAKPAPVKPTVVKYNVYDRAGGQVIGSITINLATGQFSFNGKVTPRYPLSDYKLLLEISPTTVYEWSTQGQPVSITTKTGNVHINGMVDQVLLHDLQTQASAGGYGSTWWIVYTYSP